MTDAACVCSPARQVVMRKILAKAGFAVTPCDNGRLAVDEWIANRAHALSPCSVVASFACS